MEPTKYIHTLILGLIQDLQRLPLLLINKIRGRFQIKFGMKSLFDNGGFTLIELLVVVLIIGILAAVAVPQYQKAVTKSHLAKLKSIVNTIYQARQRYYLEHGNHATRIGDLDIEWGEPDAANPGLHRLENIACSITTCANVGQKAGYVIGYAINNAGKRTCIADSRKNIPSNIATQVCKAETGKNNNSSAVGFDIYFMYTWDY